MVMALGVAASASAQATATLAGTVKDASGAVLPGASVVLVSETRGTSFETVASGTGDFVFANVPGDTYTVRVAMDGFKTTERHNIRASPGDRVAVGAITIAVGELSETVLVSGEAPIIQAQTGDRSFTISQQQVEDLPMSGRNFADFAKLTPGVVATPAGSGVRVARADGARTNYLLDGISNVNTGGNQQGIALNPDSIAEVKVVSSAYQAEYGRSTGIQISGVTKSGTNQIRGSIYELERRSSWNSNSWVNKQNDVAKVLDNQRDWGFTVGGPVGKPGGQNRLFFFFSEQFTPRNSGGSTSFFRVPTALERQGDFSQTTDQNGDLFNLIKDPASSSPCVAGNTAGCFQDGGVLGRIPADRLYKLGLNVLNSYPEPNTDGLNYNYQVTAPEYHSNTWQTVARVDYQASSKLRVSAKYAGQNALSPLVPGSMPGYNDFKFQFPAILVPSVTVDYTINNSTILEGTWGMTQGNQLGNVVDTPNANRCNVGLCDFPTLYPDNGAIPAGSFQEKVLRGMNAPFYVDGSILMAPGFAWGNRVANAPPRLAYPAFLCMQNTKDLNISVTKLWGNHTFKAGYQSQDSLKLQQLGTIDLGVLPVEGNISFANDSNNPLDTGYGYANAALGVFDSFQQQNAMYEGNYQYHNKDFYVQDNWKVNNRFTLDYGMRFTHHGPQYDTLGQASNFFPDRWSASAAPSLYTPGCSVAKNPCPSANRVAVNPLTGVAEGPAVAIGTLVPNTGDPLNGIIQAGHGINPIENYKEDPMVFGPRVGGAYDLHGDQKIVLRGSFGIFYDRLQGDSIFGQIGNPPTGQSATVYYNTLQNVAAGANALVNTPTLVIYKHDAKIGAAASWNAGVQMQLPWASALDVSYVGTHNYNSVAFGSISTPGGHQPIDLNAPDLGTAYLSQYQDPTLAPSSVPGATAVTANLMRPYPGYGAIVQTWPRFYTQYDSIQTSLTRRFSHGWSAGVSWTLGLRFKGNTLSEVHLQHNPDGTISIAPDQAQNDAVISNVGLRRRILKAHFTWDLPDFEGTGTAMRALGLLASGWQLSGVFTGDSGAPYDATFSYQRDGSNTNLTGSPNYAARIKLVGDPGSGCSSNQYRQYDATAFQGPTYGSTGNESGANLLTGCSDHTLDLTIARTIALGGHRTIQIRLDAFNALNSLVYNGRSTGIQYNSPADPTTIRNAQYNADGSINTARLTPRTAGAGAATGAQSLRTVQLQVRFGF